MSMSMISFLRTIIFTKHLHCFASFEFYSLYSYLQIWGVIGVMLLLNICVMRFISNFIFRITATSLLWGTLCWLITWRTSRRRHTRSITRGSGEECGCNTIRSSNVICFIRFDKLRDMMGGPRDYRVSQCHILRYMCYVCISRSMVSILMMNTRSQWRTLTANRRESGRTRFWLTSSTRASNPSSAGRKWGTCSTQSTSSRLSLDCNVYIVCIYLQALS